MTRSRKKRTAHQKAVDECDRLFSLLIRQLYSNGEVGNCVTHNGEWVSWRHGLQCGHYRSRRFMRTRWDRRNAGPQCGTCNKFGAPGKGTKSIPGEAEKMAQWLDRTHGEGTAAEMEILSHQVWKPSLVELQAIQQSLTDELNERGFLTR